MAESYMAEINNTHEHTYAAFEHALAHPSRETVCLRLYVSGASKRSLLAIANIKRLCEENLPGRYDLEIIDLYQQPDIAAGMGLVVAPTLIKTAPLPVRKLIGTLADPHEVLVRLDIVLH